MGNAKTKKAIKIDVVRQEVYEVELEDGLQAIYDAIDNGCNLMERAGYLENDNPNSIGDDLFVDEEGYVRGEDYIVGGFVLDLPNMPQQPLANNGLIMGHNHEGDSIDHSCDIDLIRKSVKWFVKQQ